MRSTDSTVLVRGLTGGGQAYELLYQHPALNARKSLEDRNSAIPTGNKDGFCDAGEVCMSEVAFTSFNVGPQRFIGTVIENPSQASDPGLFFDFGSPAAGGQEARDDARSLRPALHPQPDLGRKRPALGRLPGPLVFHAAAGP